MNNSCVLTATMTDEEFQRIFSDYNNADINELIANNPWGNMVNKAFVFHKQRDFLSALIFGTLAIWMYRIEEAKNGATPNPEIINPLIQLIQNCRLSYQKDLKSETETGGDDDESVEFKPEQESELKLDFQTLIGMYNEKLFINEKFIYPNQYPFLFLTERNNVLLYGPPGTGKTELAKATAKQISSNYPEFKIFFVVATAADLRSKWEGGTEKRIKGLFTYAKDLAAKYLAGEYENDPNPVLRGVPKAKAKVIIFLDEVESLASDREKDPQNSRSVTTLLQEMQGFKDGDMNNVMVLGATNFPWSLDPAFLRRFTGKLMVTLPTYDSRIKLTFNKLIEKYKKEPRFMRKRLKNLQFITTEEEIESEINFYNSSGDLTPDQDRKKLELIETLESMRKPDKIPGFTKYFNKYCTAGGRAPIGDLLGIFEQRNNIYETITQELANAGEDTEAGKKIKNEKEYIDNSYKEVDDSLSQLVQNELSFMKPDNLQPSLLTDNNQHWTNNDYEQYSRTYNQFLTNLTGSGDKLNEDIKPIYRFYLESFTRFHFGIYFIGAGCVIDNINNLYKLSAYLHYLSDVIGPSPIAKLYNLVNLQHDKTSTYANSYFGFSNSDITNLINEFFANMASSIINSHFTAVTCDTMSNICQKCGMKDAHYLDQQSIELCTQCWKRSLKEGEDVVPFTMISNGAEQVIHQGNPEINMFEGLKDDTDMYVLFKESDFDKALSRFKTTTGNDSKMCDWLFYAKENEAPSGQGKTCQKLMGGLWEKIRANTR
jgi:MoxR-like ATPase|uniref:AAA+ ATPase domain-containing protein n=1 Tax=viral metagenome TaxID=1070528 RepID=A0A6C0IZ54_9ZZZZ